VISVGGWCRRDQASSTTDAADETTMAAVTEPARRPRRAGDVVGPVARSDLAMAGPVPTLARHSFQLANGHRVGLCVSGRGVPLVVVHGFTAEGFLYADTLRRLVATGFKVVAVDMAGHGGTQGLPLSGGHLGDYAALMAQVIDELGIRRAVIAGHSMGGRVTAQLAANRPELTIAALLIDAIVGDQWDFMVNLFRLQPLLLAPLGAALLVDSMSTLPLVRDPRQAARLGQLLSPIVVNHATHPWRLVGPAASILRTRGSRGILDELALSEVPTFVLHGDRDLIVPIATARSAAKRSNGQLITIKGGGHSWLLRDPETLPAIVAELLEGRLGTAIREAIGAAGATSADELEAILYEPGAPILELTPPMPDAGGPSVPAERPRYRWTIT
jgi:pimeloyl-ACP methyl ester carboxylesterase